MSLSYAEIAEIIKLIDSSSCEELVLELDDIKLIVRRYGAGGRQAAADGISSPDPAPAADSETPDPAAQPAKARPDPSAAGGAQERADGMIEVRSPAVGTFYRVPAPDAPPFVEIGAIVSPGDPLCLIEVMKLFTTIAAEQSGRIVEVAAENGTMVEYGQVLFVLEPA